MWVMEKELLERIIGIKRTNKHARTLFFLNMYFKVYLVSDVGLYSSYICFSAQYLQIVV